MLATIILDAYKEEDAKEVKAALEENFNAADLSSGWSSAGIYCYWNYSTKEVLYFGLAVDLFERFKQHNGLIKTKSVGTKTKEIKNYFSKHEKLGFSIMVQSSLSQPFTSKLKKKYRDVWMLNPKEIEEIGADGKDSIQLMEGALIKAHKDSIGSYPSWNQMGGSLLGQYRTKPEDWELAQRFTDITPNGNSSRSSIRELKTNNLFNLFECYLHGLRINPFPLEMAIKMSEINNFSIWDEIQKNNYLKKNLEI
jgi:hypothetical protein